MLELSIFATGLLFIFAYISEIDNTLLSDVCSTHMEMSTLDKNLVDKAFSLVNSADGTLDFKLVVSAIIVQMCFISIIML